MSRHFRHGHGGNSVKMPFEKIVGENMRERARKYKQYSIGCIVGVVACFFGFMLCGMLTVSNFGRGMGLIFLPFIGFAIFGILMGWTSALAGGSASVVSLMDQIESSDKVLIRNLSLPESGEPEILHVIRLLMNSGNLPDYEVVADIMVAKKSLHITPDSIQAEEGFISIKEAPLPGKCPNCGATSGDSTFCAYCGYRLR